jgi:structural maintenance of chromosome 4
MLPHYRQSRLNGEMKQMQGSVDMKAIAAYAEKDVELQNRIAELGEVTDARDVVRARHDGLRKRRLDEFMAGFMTISLKLKEMYQMITLGGDAELELVDTLDPFSEVRCSWR